MPNDCQILVFISGRGSNLKSLISNSTDYSICGVLSDKADAAGLNIAKDAGIPTAVFSPDDYKDRDEQQQAMLAFCLIRNPDALALAGFMQIVRKPFLTTWEAPIFNIHPSLLPKYPGLHTHQRALDANESVHGCTVHLVDSGVDTGPIVAQASCSVEKDDSIDSLSERVLEREHQLYPWVLNAYARGDIQIDKTHVIYEARARTEASDQQFFLSGGTYEH